MFVLSSTNIDTSYLFKENTPNLQQWEHGIVKHIVTISSKDWHQKKDQQKDPFFFCTSPLLPSLLQCLSSKHKGRGSLGISMENKYSCFIWHYRKQKLSLGVLTLNIKPQAHKKRKRTDRLDNILIVLGLLWLFLYSSLTIQFSIKCIQQWKLICINATNKAVMILS